MKTHIFALHMIITYFQQHTFTMTKTEIFIISLLLTHYIAVTATGFREKLEIAIIRHQELQEGDDEKEQIGRALQFLEINSQSTPIVPDEILKTLQRLSLASEENNQIYQEVLTLCRTKLISYTYQGNRGLAYLLNP